MWALIGCFFSPPCCFITCLSLYLWAVKWGGQRKKQENYGGKDGSKYAVIELNCAPCPLQARVVLQGRAQTQIAHTHKHADKWASLAFCLSHHCRHSDKPLWFHMQAHICDCYAHWAFAGTWRQISHCLFVEYMCTLRMPVHIYVQRWVFSIKRRNQQSFFEQSLDKDAFSQIFTPCSAEYILFAYANGCIDEKDLLPPPLILPQGYLHDCDPVMPSHII